MIHPRLVGFNITTVGELEKRGEERYLLLFFPHSILSLLRTRSAIRV
jgi:uncharacterized membrane protein